MTLSSPDIVMSLRGVGKRFNARGHQLEVMRDVNLDVYKGEFLVIVGPSGSGKSTLLRMIQGLEPLSAGTVETADGQLQGVPRDRGFVFQQDGLYPWRTILKNVTFGLELRNVPTKLATARAQEMIDLVGLTGFERHYPRELSGGMRQRVNLARALAIDPTTLLMDEPFAALDALTREHMQQELIRIAEKTRKTVVLITHQIDEAVLLADRVAVLHGKPAHITNIVPIDLPKPRTIAMKRTAKFQAYVDQIWTMVSGETIPAVV
jgi:NitT/TauT family transport system ATP-binding protein